MARRVLLTDDPAAIGLDPDAIEALHTARAAGAHGSSNRVPRVSVLMLTRVRFEERLRGRIRDRIFADPTLPAAAVANKPIAYRKPAR